jgi:hypothetical protein
VEKIIIIIIIINRFETELEKAPNVAAVAVAIFFSWLLDSLGDVLLLLCPLVVCNPKLWQKCMADQLHKIEISVPTERL